MKESLSSELSRFQGRGFGKKSKRQSRKNGVGRILAMSDCDVTCHTADMCRFDPIQFAIFSFSLSVDGE